MDILQNLLGSISPLTDGDLIDRLNYYHTTVMLAIFSMFISGWSFVGKPIQCWFPAYYKGWWMQYALDYCYVQNTYFLPFTDVKATNYWDIASHIVQIPQNITHRDEKMLGYYQWVPFLLSIEAILFYMPVLIWRGLYNGSGLKVKAICETCNYKQNMDPSDRAKHIEMVSRFIDHSTEISSQMRWSLGNFMAGRYVLTLYLFIKSIFAINCVLQFFMLKTFLGLNNFWWGFQVFADLMAGREWPVTGNFPRVTYCDFEVRVLGNLHRYTVQCTLIINMFNEKIFLFLWWWFLLVGICSIISLIYWLSTSLFERGARRLIGNYLDKIDRTTVLEHRAGRRQLVREFVQKRLKPDGVFLLRLISSNSGDLIACQLVESLWRRFQSDHRKNLSTISKSDPDERVFPTLPMPPPYEDEQPLLRARGKNESKETHL